MTETKYPAGKIRDDDEGELGIAITATDARVFLAFNKSVRWIGMLPEQARKLAASLLEKASIAEGTIHDNTGTTPTVTRQSGPSTE